jgi:hypothetical protein
MEFHLVRSTGEIVIWGWCNVQTPEIFHSEEFDFHESEWVDYTAVKTATKSDSPWHYAS